MAGNAHLDRVLGMPSIVLFGLAYLVPLTVFTTYGVVTESTAGHLPAAYVVTLVAMLFTAYSYGLMVRAHPYAGSAYTYTQRAFGPHLGFMTGWTLLLDYLFLPMINYLVMGIYLEAAFPGVPVAVWIIGAILLVTGLNILGIRLVARMNFVLVAVQVVFIAVFLVAAGRTIAGSDLPSLTEPFLPSGGEASAVLGGAAILCLSFLGFDAVSTLAEETHDPRRRIPRAIMLVTVIGGALFILLSYVGHLVFPRYSEFTDVDSAALDVVGTAGGAALTAFFTAAYIAGCFGSAMASQASVSRILYAMGRDGALPSAVFGRLHPRFGRRRPAVVHRAGHQPRAGLFDDQLRRAGGVLARQPVGRQALRDRRGAPDTGEPGGLRSGAGHRCAAHAVVVDQPVGHDVRRRPRVDRRRLRLPARAAQAVRPPARPGRSPPAPTSRGRARPGAGTRARSRRAGPVPGTAARSAPRAGRRSGRRRGGCAART
jgi:hypothetical protein